MATTTVDTAAAAPIYTRNRAKINWITTTAMAIFHAGAIAALFMFSWKALAVAVALFFVGGLGIGMGYHRLLTHRSYATPKWIEYLLTFCAMLTLEGGPIFWVATHRLHHQYSDHPGVDPHTPRDGKWWSHMGWILMGETLHQDYRQLARYAPDLAKDPVHVFLTKWHWVPITIVGIVLLALGGWPLVFWGIFLRTVCTLHVTWLVNSATHIWGTRRYKTRDDSTNNFLIALLTFGEGWHNNHHAMPTSARHGLAWYELDLNWYGISLLRALGLAKKIHVARLPENPGQEPVPASASIIELLSA